MGKGDWGKRVVAMIPGLILILMTFVILRLYVEAWLGQVFLFGQKGWLVKVLHLNYVLLAILIGMFYRNVLFRGKIPAWASEGLNLSRLLLKTGIILLGSLYTYKSLMSLGALALSLIAFFVFFSISIVILLGHLMRLERPMIGVMSAACGICGVSAAIATAPAVKARATEVAYAIGTILGFGILTMLISPTIGTVLGMSDLQFGAWMGTGILNSGQVLAAALAFNPTVAPGSAVAVAEVWNVIRVVMIPIVVFVLAIWFSAGSDRGQRPGLWILVKEKFPLFVLGFLAMVLLTTLNAFGPTGAPGEPPAADTIKVIRNTMVWFFGIGLVGLGAFVDVREILKAGGRPFQIGVLTGLAKWVLAGLAVLLWV